MNIKTFLDIFIAIVIIVEFTIVMIQLIIYKKEITKQVNELYDNAVKNECDKQEIYKRLAELELNKEVKNNDRREQEKMQSRN